ncbi:DUF4199 domain-containing protein [Paucihalobacter ruber]|uniref:DUF4199 domain-containing protein n=1 Tax=Paucihalobacter ruber TaxID=2567861 RepID=A0A506PEF9_9FLAO|nr:DUF4199 domain-containing protein [Paucihalobacter ruber]TPV31422.1 DUF4199 domain-containing protein [Paucihalobacter ruber]
MKNLRTEIKWAIIFTLVGLLWMVLEKMAGLHDQYIDYHLYLTNLFAIPAIIMMVMALKEKKRDVYGGSMSYKQGLISGIILSLFIAILSPLAQYITTYYITPDYFPNVIKRSVEIGYYPDIEAAKANFNYQNYAIQGAVSAFIMGVITTAIAMIFIRTKKG